MTVRSRIALCLISVAVAGALAACGGSNAVTGPEIAGAVPTATIAGTVVSDSAAVAPAGDVSSRSAAGGLRVTAVGTSLETTTDDAGRFSLGGLSAGEKVELRFEGPGIDARLEIEGLVAGQVLTVNVSVSGSSASMTSSSGEVEFQGTVDSVGPSSLVVAGRTVQVVPGTTELLGRQDQPIDLSEIVPGAFVEVEGWEQSDGSLLGKKVKLEDDDDDDDENEDNEIEFTGSIQSLSPLTVAGRRVTTNGGTRILDDDNDPIALSALQVDMRVEVEGWPQPDASVLAKKIEIED